MPEASMSAQHSRIDERTRLQRIKHRILQLLIDVARSRLRVVGRPKPVRWGGRSEASNLDVVGHGCKSEGARGSRRRAQVRPKKRRFAHAHLASVSSKGAVRTCPRRRDDAGAGWGSRNGAAAKSNSLSHRQPSRVSSAVAASPAHPDQIREVIVGSPTRSAHHAHARGSLAKVPASRPRPTTALIPADRSCRSTSRTGNGRRVR